MGNLSQTGPLKKQIFNPSSLTDEIFMIGKYQRKKKHYKISVAHSGARLKWAFQN